MSLLPWVVHVRPLQPQRLHCQVSKPIHQGRRDLFRAEIRQCNLLSADTQLRTREQACRIITDLQRQSITIDRHKVQNGVVTLLSRDLLIEHNTDSVGQGSTTDHCNE